MTRACDSAYASIYACTYEFVCACVCVCCMYMPVVMLMNNLCCFPQNNFWDISKYHVLDYSISLKGNLYNGDYSIRVDSCFSIL